MYLVQKGICADDDTGDACSLNSLLHWGISTCYASKYTTYFLLQVDYANLYQFDAGANASAYYTQWPIIIILFFLDILEKKFPGGWDLKTLTQKVNQKCQDTKVIVLEDWSVIV